MIIKALLLYQWLIVPKYNIHLDFPIDVNLAGERRNPDTKRRPPPPAGRGGGRPGDRAR
jgi:hypothetical protein